MVHKMVRRVNINVSTSAVSRAEKVVIGELLVIGDGDTLKKFLQPFAELTDLVSSEQPHLAVIPLIIREV